MPVPDPPEPSITINGHELTEAQALTMRVALQCFALQIEYAEDQTSRNYLDRIAEINAFMSPQSR